MANNINFINASNIHKYKRYTIYGNPDHPYSQLESQRHSRTSFVGSPLHFVLRQKGAGPICKTLQYILGYD